MPSPFGRPEANSCFRRAFFLGFFAETLTTPTPHRYRYDVTFYGPSCFSTVKDGADLGSGDIFYDHPAAYQMPWGEALSHVSHKLVITNGSKGADKIVEFSIDTLVGGSWITGEKRSTNQKSFWTENSIVLVS